MERIDAADESFWAFKGQEEYSDKKFLVASPFPIAFILISYLWFVLKFGPQLMKKRPPFILRNWLILYNAVQVVLSCYLFQWGLHFLTQKGVWHSTCYYEHDDLRKEMHDGNHLYFIAKVIELLDTVFFVLRKKQRQVSFLHVYHHTIMVIATWSIVKYNKTDSVVFLGTINSFVHIIMYGYYGLSVFPGIARFLWWKKYITIMQLIQFSLMFLHVVVSHAISECRPAHILLFSVTSNSILFMYLFGDFYIKSYIKKYRENAAKVASNNAKNGLNSTMNQHKLANKIH